jgi:hypothetical protein
MLVTVYETARHLSTAALTHEWTAAVCNMACSGKLHISANLKFVCWSPHASVPMTVAAPLIHTILYATMSSVTSSVDITQTTYLHVAITKDHN